MVALNRNSKPDTRLFLDFAAGADEVDYSQYRTNLTNNTTYLSEANSARAALDAPRELTVVVDITSGETGVLIDHGDGVNYAYRIDIVATNTVRCRIDGSTILSASLPNTTTGDRRFLISWCTRPEGASYYSELYVHNLTAGGVVWASATHSIVAADPTHTLTIGAARGGDSPFAGGLDFFYVRIGERFHSTTEQAEDWLSQTTPPAMTMTRRRAPRVLDRSTLALASDGAFVGPAHLLAGDAFQQSDRRLVGPLLNIRPTTPVNMDNGYDMPSTAWWRTAPGDSSVHMCAAHLFYVPVPDKVNRAYVRLYVRLQNAASTTAAPVSFYVYSLSGLPVIGEPARPLVYYRTAAAVCSTDHGSGAGEWLAPGAVALALDDLHATHFAVGVKVDETHAQAADTTFQVFALTFEPYFEPADDTGLDLVEA